MLPSPFSFLFFLSDPIVTPILRCLMLSAEESAIQARSKNSFHLPYCRTNVRKFSLRFQGPKIFNSLSSEIQNASSIALFNSKLMSLFLV